MIPLYKPFLLLLAVLSDSYKLCYPSKPMKNMIINKIVKSNRFIIICFLELILCDL